MNFARYLQWLKVNKSINKWEYESHTFWFEGLKRGTVSYKPDFFILENDGIAWYAEVKGYFDSKSLTKIKRFKRYYPNLNLRIIDKNWFTRNNKQMKGLIKEWE